MDRFLVNDMARSKANQEALSKLQREIDELSSSSNTGDIKQVEKIESEEPNTIVNGVYGPVTVFKDITVRNLNYPGSIPTHRDNLIVGFEKVQLTSPVIRDTTESFPGMLKYSNGELFLYANGVWRVIQLVPDGLYDFSTFTFTTGGNIGYSGPSLSTLLNSYNTTTYPWLIDTNNFKMSGYQGIQEWTVPKSGDYRIQAAGAGDFNPRGAGVNVHITTALVEGEILRIVCGQQGMIYSGGSSGGSGGSFVVRAPYNTNASIILIAGGGGGQYLPNSQLYAEDATNFTFGLSSGSGNIPGGSNGNGGGGNNNSGASAGGGFFSNGGQGSFGSGGQSFINGAQGGSSSSTGSSYGGFGGGGSTHGNTGGGGGGGGYSGGAGGEHATTVGNGGGAGSYGFGGTTPTFISYNEAPGFVIITKI